MDPTGCPLAHTPLFWHSTTFTAPTTATAPRIRWFLARACGTFDRTAFGSFTRRTRGTRVLQDAWHALSLPASAFHSLFPLRLSPTEPDWIRCRTLQFYRYVTPTPYRLTPLLLVRRAPPTLAHCARGMGRRGFCPLSRGACIALYAFLHGVGLPTADRTSLWLLRSGMRTALSTTCLYSRFHRNIPQGALPTRRRTNAHRTRYLLPPKPTWVLLLGEWYSLFAFRVPHSVVCVTTPPRWRTTHISFVIFWFFIFATRLLRPLHFILDAHACAPPSL